MWWKNLIVLALIAAFAIWWSEQDDRAHAVQEAVASAPSPEPTTQAEATVDSSASASVDNSELPELIGVAKEQRRLAMELRQQVETSCLTFPPLNERILADADGAEKAWDTMKANDQAKVLRNACLNALNDVGEIARDCNKKPYDTVDAAVEKEQYRSDIKDCNELLKHPPRLDATLDDTK